ncbi:MAG: hypothetical protein HY788_12350 [Deltaproteobacteria bacterium]|nr:hypothetical protein [Deltaproteobacteria bacterium]
MKCPKCGFISFDYLDSCRQCSTDLRETRRKLGLGLMPSSKSETLLGPAVAESTARSDKSDFTFQEPEAESNEELVFSDSDLFEESDLGFSTEQLELGLGDARAPLEGGQSGSGDLGPIEFDFDDSGGAKRFAAEPSARGPAPSVTPEPIRQQGPSDLDLDEFELSEGDPAFLSDTPETPSPESKLPPPGEGAAFSIDMQDLLQDTSGLHENDLELTSIDEEDLSLDDLDEFELLDESAAGRPTANAEQPKQTTARAEDLANDLNEWKLEDALDLSDDELLDAIPDLESEDKK